jgi:hypothetical protein
MKRKIILTLSIICFLLFSIAYFLWVYRDVGFVFNIKCMLVWSLCLTAYTLVLGFYFALMEDLFFRD